MSTRRMKRPHQSGAKEPDELRRPLPDHGAGDVDDDQQPDVADPRARGEHPGHQGRRHSHQHHREQQAEDQHPDVLPGHARHREHVVERHGKIGDHDLPDRLAHRLSARLRMQEMHGALRLGPGVVHVRAQLLPQFPAHPREEQPADQEHPRDLQKLHRDQRKPDPHHHRERDADRDDPGALPFRQPRRSHADHDRVVPREDEVDEDHLQQRARRAEREELLHWRLPERTHHAPESRFCAGGVAPQRAALTRPRPPSGSGCRKRGESAARWEPCVRKRPRLVPPPPRRRVREAQSLLACRPCLRCSDPLPSVSPGPALPPAHYRGEVRRLGTSPAAGHHESAGARRAVRRNGLDHEGRSEQIRKSSSDPIHR